MCAPAPSQQASYRLAGDPNIGNSAGDRIPVRDGTENFDLGFLNRGENSVLRAETVHTFSAPPSSPSPSPAQYVSQRITLSQTVTAEMPESDFHRPDNSLWRDEVASRVQAHRARRRRRFDPEASMSLGFETAVMDEPAECLETNLAANAPFASPFSESHSSGRFSEARVSTVVEEVEMANPMQEEDFLSAQVSEEFQPQPGPEQTRIYERIALRNSAPAARRVEREADYPDSDCDSDSNLIEFPRPAIAQSLFTDELAEPITSPRILDVPDPVVEAAPPPLATIRLDEDKSIADWVREYEEAEAALELPLQVAPLAPRVLSGVIDAVLVLTAAAVFSMIVLSVAKFVPQGKPAMAVAVFLPAGLWAVYQYIFLVFAGITPGMMMAQLELSSFEGCVPQRKTRASRALALMLCCVSLGLGFAWAMVDEDNLGWHDRMTRTYLRQS